MNTQAYVLPDHLNQRREHRIAATRPFTGGMFVRLKGQADLPVVGLRNISAGGASVVVGRALTQHQDISIGLTVGGTRMAFAGRVAWCRPINKDDLLPDLTLADGEALFAVGMMIHGPGSFSAMVHMADSLETATALAV